MYLDYESIYIVFATGWIVGYICGHIFPTGGKK